MAKSENKWMIYLLFGVVTEVLVLYAIVVAPGYHRYMLHLKTSNKTGKSYKINNNNNSNNNNNNNSTCSDNNTF